MQIDVYPSEIAGSIGIRASKSMIQRTLAAALLSKGKTTLHYMYFCDDTKSAIRVIKSLGAKVTRKKDTLIIEGGLSPMNHCLDVGESGLGIRLFSPIAALHNQPIQIIGRGSLLNRQMDMMEAPLKKLGVDFTSTGGKLPLTVCGPLSGGEAEIDGSVTSQFLTGLLMAMPCAEKDTILKVNDLKSVPYVELTLSILEQFGITVKHDKYKTFQIPGNQSYSPITCEMEGDWSGAAFLLVGGAISGDLEIVHISVNSKQADIAILKALRLAGAKVVLGRNSVQVSSSRLNSFFFDARDCPDLFPPLAVLAANCKGTSSIKGTSRLFHKESNRALTIQKEFHKLGVEIELRNDIMYVTGGEVHGGTIHSNFDHRIAMAGAILALNANGKVTIDHAEAVNKSYPDFFRDLQLLNVKMNMK